MSKPTLHTAETTSARIGYFEYGSPAGAPVLLLHGFPDSPVAWIDLIESLEEEVRSKYRLIVPYLRGFGPTEVTSLDLVGGQEAALGQDVLELADALGLDRFHLAGHDWGSRTAYAVCVLKPERVLSLLALASPYLMYGGKDLPPEQVNSYWYQWYFQLELGRKMMSEEATAKAFCHQLWRAWSPEWKFSEKEFSAAAEAWTNPQFADTVLHYYRMRWGGTLSLRAYGEQQTKLDAKPKAKIAAPTIYVGGAADNCVLPDASEEQRSAFTGSYEHVMLKGIGHFPHREDPKAVAKHFTRLLEKSR